METFSHLRQRRNSAPDVPEDVMDHFNDPNWDYTSSPTASVSSFDDEKRQTWTDHSFRSSDVESSRFASSPTGRLDLREVPMQNMNE